MSGGKVSISGGSGSFFSICCCYCYWWLWWWYGDGDDDDDDDDVDENCGHYFYFYFLLNHKTDLSSIYSRTLWKWNQSRQVSLIIDHDIIACNLSLNIISWVFRKDNTYRLPERMLHQIYLHTDTTKYFKNRYSISNTNQNVFTTGANLGFPETP